MIEPLESMAWINTLTRSITIMDKSVNANRYTMRILTVDAKWVPLTEIKDDLRK